MKNENGYTPAYPLTEDQIDHCERGGNYSGLTKREEAAFRAMQGLLSNSGGVIQQSPISGFHWCNGDAKQMASIAVECADAILAELDK